jgi:DNA-binding transcriptional MerR regulator
MYTVKQLSELANVSVRTLHHYDAIGLLRPTQVGANGYRYYDDSALLRLQQILFYRELDMELVQIKDTLDQPEFDLVSALHSHRAALKDKIDHLHSLIETIDATIEHVLGETPMSKKQFFKPFSDEKQKDYEREIRLQYGPESVKESQRNWGSYSKAEQQKVLDEIVAAIKAQTPANSAEAQSLMTRWHNHIRYFYEPTLEILRGLGELYTTHPDFITNFAKLHAELGDYMKVAINQYVDDLEYAEIERMLAEDAATERKT